VVDGTPIDNSTFTTLAQRFGFGGFDYGTAVQDLNLGDIANVQVLAGPEAAMLYGGRAANGVVLVNTRSGRGLNALHVSASQQVTFESALKLPTYQNSYGQGLGGKFAFFNGAGGGVNDGVAENWGPVIQGQPIAQASLVEAKRGDVRPWVTHPDNVSGYFDGARALTTRFAAQGSNDRASFHASVNNRDFTGLTPGASVARRGFSLNAAVQPTALFTATGNIQYFNDEALHRPGSGYDESNPVSGFARLGRQVDVQALRDHLRDATDNPISWNYAGHNNPYFEPLLNSNDDQRTRWLGGFGAAYQLNASITATGHVGGDSYDIDRRFRVAPGWMTGYPYSTGRVDFKQGGREKQAISVGEKNAEFALHVSPGGSASRVVFSAGLTWRSNTLTSLDSVLVDTTSGNNATAPKATTTNTFSSNTTNKSVFGAAELRFPDIGKVTISARNEWASAFPAGHDAQLYPSIIGSLDLKRAVSSLRQSNTVNGASLRAGLSRSGNDVTPYALQNIYTGNQSSDNVSLSPNLKLGTSTTLEPETTNAFELGGDIQLFHNRLGVDLTVYSENTSNLILAVASQGTATPTNAGSLSNRGIEATVNLTPVMMGGLEWDISSNFARNSSSVESLNGSVQSIPLAPARWGVGLEARKGQPLGVLVGNRFLRDQSGRLILRQGRPLPDTVAGPRVLGTSSPSWTGGLSNTVRFGWVEVSALLTARMGGHVFSASNYWGATSGSLDETAFRPDTGLLIAGVDAATGNANTQHVTTEDYYHALRAIPERWVYSANVVKLREARLSVNVPLRVVPGFRTQAIRASFIGRNLLMWTKAPNIDPETAVSVLGFEGFELGQLPTTRSVGFQITITP
jgi:TonB-dependent SusC/RagA subfamily outer membrane receptor